MSNNIEKIFQTNAPVYWAKGYSAIPIKQGSKAPAITQWSGYNANLPSVERQSEWLKKHPDAGLGICTGTPLADGSILLAIDVDEPRLVRFIEKVVRNSPCKKVGKKGVTIFARAPKRTKSRKFGRAKGSPQVEIFGTTGCIVLPPSIHPDTGMPYQWVGTPLHDIDSEELPLLTEGLSQGDRLGLVLSVDDPG